MWSSESRYARPFVTGRKSGVFYVTAEQRWLLLYVIIFRGEFFISFKHA
jgi:hypothetical protein